jgi:hypothetical protein
MQSAQRKSDEVRTVLNQRRLFMFPSEQQLGGQIPVWESYFNGPYASGILNGDWSIHGRWRYWSDPTSGEPMLQESSVGVTVRNHGHVELPTPVCVARYDVELHGAARGRHLNVYQPVVSDSIHWVYLDDASRYDDWSFQNLLDFFVSQLPQELLTAGWPRG